VPFTFINPQGLAEEQAVNAWLKGVALAQMGSAVE